ncbi:putative outer membrane porin protein [Shigella dysenteriae]|nr:putative outer membrane porin protein [Shigella dysenteriae]
MISVTMVIKLMPVSALKINDQMIGFGHWEYDFKGYNDEANGSRGNKTRLAYAGLVMLPISRTCVFQ